MPSFNCPICQKTLRSKQMLQYHVANNVCLRRQIGVKMPLRLKSDTNPQKHIGIDIDNINHYIRLISEDNIKLPLSKGISSMDLIKLFSTIHKLGNNEYGHPISHIEKINENSNPLALYDVNAKYNVYKYYNSSGPIVSSLDDIDFIKCVYDQLLSCYLIYCSDQISNHYKIIKYEQMMENIQEIAKMKLDNAFSSFNGRKIVKKYIDSHYGDGKYDNIMSKTSNYYQQKKEILELYKKSILSDNRHVSTNLESQLAKINYNDMIELEELLVINGELTRLGCDPQQFQNFKMSLLKLSELVI